MKNLTPRQSVKQTPARKGAAGGEGDEEHDDVVFGQMGQRKPLIPEGEYLAGFLRSEPGRVKNRVRWFNYFQIATPGDYLGTVLFFSFLSPPEGEPFGLSSKLVAAATVVFGRLPTRRDRLSPRSLFKGKYFLAHVTSVKHDSERQLRKPEDWYSVIDRLLALHAGPGGAA